MPKLLIKYSFLAYFFIITLILFNCKNEPNELGLNYLPPDDTAGVLILDSETDTIAFYHKNILKYVSNYSSSNLLIGNYQGGYNASFITKFKNLPDYYDSATVLSAVMYLKYNNYYFKDSLGTTSFNIYRIINYKDISTLKYDEFSPADYDIQVGTYTGTPTDTITVSIALDTNLIRDWLNYSADTINYPIKNYGIAFIPNTNCNTIKAFNSINSATGYTPYIEVILTKNSETDTIYFNSLDGTSLVTAPSTIIPNQRFITLSGVSYRHIMRFDLSKLPANSIINQAYLEFTIDTASSFYSTFDRRLYIEMLTDTTEYKTDGYIFYANLKNYITYNSYLNYIFQNWTSGVYPNLGIMLSNTTEITNLDEFVFYSSDNPEPSLRPRLTIRYTIRN